MSGIVKCDQVQTVSSIVKCDQVQTELYLVMSSKV